jgi:hypothetical protein
MYDRLNRPGLLIVSCSSPSPSPLLCLSITFFVSLVKRPRSPPPAAESSSSSSSSVWKERRVDDFSFEDFQPFWKALVSLPPASDQPDRLILNPGTNLLGQPSLGSAMYIRPCYSTITDRIWYIFSQLSAGKRGVVLTGNPGIGKSMMLVYLLRRIAREGAVAVIQKQIFKKVIVCSPDGSSQYFETIDDPFIQRLLRKESTYYLYDGVKGAPPPDFAFVVAKTLVLTSPDPDLLKEFQKHHPIRLYMPVWLKVEVSAARLICHPTVEEQKIAGATDPQIATLLPTCRVTADEAEERFSHFGGLVRYIFRHSLDADFLQLQGVVSKQLLSSILPSIGLLETMPDVSHRVLHYHVASDDFTRVAVHYASDWVYDQLLTSSARQLTDGIIQFMQSSANQPLLGALRGYMFERYAHTVIPRGGTFNTRLLKAASGNAAAALEPIVQLNLPALTEVRFTNAQEIPKLIHDHAGSNLYLRPKFGQHPSIDALAVINVPNPSPPPASQVVLYLFQVTVGKQHPLKLKFFEEINLALFQAFGVRPNVLPLYIMLPPDQFAQARTPEPYHTQDGRVASTPPTNVFQYALSVPLVAGSAM